jgi:cytochrome c biogenesis protein CcmG/thiol:disulfide interchange protein DsbE
MIKKLLMPVLLILVLGILYRGLYIPKTSGIVTTPIHVLPKFKVFDLQQKRYRDLEAWQGKPLLIHFWASWCDNCRAELPILAKYKYKIIMIGVDYKDTEDAAKPMMSLWQDTFKATYADTNGRLGLDLGVVATPETFLVNKYGHIVFHYQGLISDAIFMHEFLPLIGQS